jgi:hypothetical protein
MLLPAIEAGVEASKGLELADAHDREPKQEFLCQALGAFDKTASKELNATDSQAWSLLVKCLKQYHGQSRCNFVMLVSEFSDHGI